MRMRREDRPWVVLVVSSKQYLGASCCNRNLT
jgi:hypothetical protein